MNCRTAMGVSTLCILAVLATATSSARGQNTLPLDDMSTLEKWKGSHIEHSPERGGALQWTLTPGKSVEGVTMSLAPFKVDPKEYDRLKFDYKIEGPVRWFGVKIRHYLLEDGKQMVYRAYGPGEGGEGWREASLPLNSPSAVWENRSGGKPEALSLRAQPDKASPCVIQVRNPRFVKLPVKASVLETPGAPAETRCEITLKNTDTKAHEVDLSLDTTSLRAFGGSLSTTHLTVAPNASAVATVRLSLKPGEKRAPLYAENTTIRVAVRGEPDCGDVLRLTATVPLPKLDRPFVFTTKEQIANAKKNIEKYPWARKIYDAMMKRSDRLLEAPIEIPDRTGSWGHYYSCKACGSRLRTVTPTQHKCRGCGKEYSGDPYDAVVVAWEHSRWAKNTRDLGLAFAFTDDVKYAKRSAEIFKEYERKYRTYTPQTHRGVMGRGWKVISYRLGQSVWAIPIAQGYDFIRDAGVLTDEERERIETDFFRDIAKSVMGHRGIHNITCWRNAAVGTIGLAIDDPELVRWAIEAPAGLRQEIAEGILEDGFWFEGSWGYHFYALSPLCYLSESAGHVGIDVFDKRFESMFTAPIRFMTAYHWLPAFNDSGRGSYVSPNWRYVVAARHYPGNKEIAWLLAPAVEGNKLGGVESLLYFPDRIAEVESPPMKSSVFQGSGIVILRSVPGTDPVYVAFEYGPHGGGHGHPDKLGFVLCALGTQLAVDPGSISYAVPLFKRWYRQTLAHNTLVVDQKSQQRTTGELLYMHNSPELQIAACRTTEAYPGVRFDRTIAIVANECVLIVDDVASEKEHLYDIAYHIRGELKTDLALQPAGPLGESEGYDVLEDVKQGKGGDLFRAEFVLKPDDPPGVRMLAAGAGGADIITALAPGNPPTQRVPCLIFRKRGKTARYATLLEPHRGQAKAKRIAIHPVQDANGATDDGAIAVSIESEQWRAAGLLAKNKARRLCPDLKLEADATAAFVLWQNGEVSSAVVVDGESVSVDGKRIVAKQ